MSCKTFSCYCGHDNDLLMIADFYNRYLPLQSFILCLLCVQIPFLLYNFQRYHFPPERFIKIFYSLWRRCLLLKWILKDRARIKKKQLKPNFYLHEYLLSDFFSLMIFKSFIFPLIIFVKYYYWISKCISYRILKILLL